MELLSLASELLQSGAERAASYRPGQVALRHADRALWALEKSARWAVPPPLDVDERQPELVRPLPWVFFLALLAALRVTRESISLLNLVMGKPPLRSADVVAYIQSKRRYLRTLKYQGNRMMRARTSGQARESWYTHLQTMMEFTMCFRRPYNNNTTRISNNDEVVVLKRSKKTQDNNIASTENTMERLIEKMMVDLDADTDDDSSYTLTNPASIKTDSDITESEHESAESPHSSHTKLASSTPNKDDSGKNTTTEISPEKTNSLHKSDVTESPTKEPSPEKNRITDLPQEKTEKRLSDGDVTIGSNGNHSNGDAEKQESDMSPKRSTQSFLDNEKQRKPPKKSQKIANGRTIENPRSKTREITRQNHRNN